VAVPVSIFRLLAAAHRSPDPRRPARDPAAGVRRQRRDPGARRRLPRRGRRKAGDLVVHLAPQHPAFLGKEQKAMLEMAEQVLQHQLDSQCPALAAWNVVLDAHR
jgi:hypothetical protein